MGWGIAEPGVGVVVALELGLGLLVAPLLFGDLFQVLEDLHLDHLVILLVQGFFEFENGFVLGQERVLESLFGCDTLQRVFLKHFGQKVDSITGNVLVLLGFEVELGFFVFVQDCVSTK